MWVELVRLHLVLKEIVLFLKGEDDVVNWIQKEHVERMFLHCEDDLLFVEREHKVKRRQMS